MRSDYTDKKGQKKEYRAMEDKKRTYFKRMFNSIFYYSENLYPGCLFCMILNVIVLLRAQS